MAKKKKKLAPRPKPKPKAKPVDTSMGDNEFIADLLTSPMMKNNPLAKLGLYGLLPEERTPLPVEAYDDPIYEGGFYVINPGSKPHKFNFGSKVKEKGMVPIKSVTGEIRYRYPQDIERMLIKDKTYINVNPISSVLAARQLDKMKKVPEGTTSKFDAQINTIIHELMHRGFFKVPALKKASEEQQHRYIEEKEKLAYLNPDADKSSGDTLMTKYYETLLQNDPKARKYIKTHMPELEFYTFGNDKWGRYKEKEKDSNGILKKIFMLLGK